MATNRRWMKGTALMASGVLAGGILAGTLTANAQDNTTSTAPGTSASAPADDEADQSRSQRPDEELLTGDIATQVEEAALAEYPGATIVRLETDSDGVYEAHLTTADGEKVTVELDGDFVITGEEVGGPHR